MNEEWVLIVVGAVASQKWASYQFRPESNTCSLSLNPIFGRIFCLLLVTSVAVTVAGKGRLFKTWVTRLVLLLLLSHFCLSDCSHQSVSFFYCLSALHVHKESTADRCVDRRLYHHCSKLLSNKTEIECSPSQCTWREMAAATDKSTSSDLSLSFWQAAFYVGTDKLTATADVAVDEAAVCSTSFWWCRNIGELWEPESKRDWKCSPKYNSVDVD